MQYEFIKQEEKKYSDESLEAKRQEALAFLGNKWILHKCNAKGRKN